jgi:hypothetical protein
MKKPLTMLTVVGVAAAFAAPAGAKKPTTTTPKVPSASSQCKTEKAGMGKELFKLAYGTNDNRSNAMGKCVSKRNAETRAARKAAGGDQAKTAKTVKAQVKADVNAAKQCKGTPRNAFGKCVSALAKEQSQQS